MKALSFPGRFSAVNRLTLAALGSVAIGLAFVACAGERLDRGAATAQAIKYAPVACGVYSADDRIPREPVLDEICRALLPVPPLSDGGDEDAGAVSARDSGDPAPALSVTPGNAVRSVDGGG